MQFMNETAPVFLADIHRIFMVGIKGTGMCALAELLVSKGKHISGSDVQEEFYTDSILKKLAIPVLPFAEQNINADIDLIIFSAAYKPDSHPELLAAQKCSIPLMTYPQALGAFSKLQPSCGIAGVHGKTTTTAICGTIAAALKIPATVLAASAVKSFGDKSTLILGDDFFIAETCEYRRHFLNFNAQIIVVTSIEPDHQDYYPDYDSIYAAFLEYGLSLPQNGCLVFCADDSGALALSNDIAQKRPDIKLIPYGFSCDGDFKITKKPNHAGIFALDIFPDHFFSLRIPGLHIMLDAVAAIAVCSAILENLVGIPRSQQNAADFMKGIAAFSGSKRRAEIIGEVSGIMFMDDYAHHPTAIKMTLQGLKDFYPGRRLVVDFMSHTYSRTQALFADFATAFTDADVLILHDIYPSAREKAPEEWKVSGLALFNAVAKNSPSVKYFSKPLDAFTWIDDQLRSGDLFITLGAGDNWVLSQELFRKRKEEND